MQLNNPNTGAIIRLISAHDSGIAFDYFQNGMISQGERRTIAEAIDNDYLPDIPLSRKI